MQATINLSEIDSASVDEIVVGAFSMLVDDDNCSVSGEAPTSAMDISVAVYCDSNQQSAVVLRCSRLLATRLTGKMLELSPEEIVAEDIADATGELVNVIAGNLRGLVSSPDTMTAPFVVDSAIYAQLAKGAVNNYTVTGEVLQVIRM